jgi:hypothetical protein
MGEIEDYDLSKFFQQKLKVVPRLDLYLYVVHVFCYSSPMVSVIQKYSCTSTTHNFDRGQLSNPINTIHNTMQAVNTINRIYELECEIDALRRENMLLKKRLKYKYTTETIIQATESKVARYVKQDIFPKVKFPDSKSLEVIGKKLLQSFDLQGDRKDIFWATYRPTVLKTLTIHHNNTVQAIK